MDGSGLLPALMPSLLAQLAPRSVKYVVETVALALGALHGDLNEQGVGHGAQPTLMSSPFSSISTGVFDEVFVATHAQKAR